MDRWLSGDTVALRGLVNQQVWHVQSTRVVWDTPEEIALLLVPGAECAAPSGYIHKKHGDNSYWDRWQEFLGDSWSLEKYLWRNNRFLILLEPLKYYASIYIWDHASNVFKGYYINFQLPFKRCHCGFDTYDLELDIVINPDFQWYWKDVDDYQRGLQIGAICTEWVSGVEQARKEILDRLAGRLYPLNGRWLSWQPEKEWTPPQLPRGWEKQE
jgi:hypothetical protein